MKLSYDSHNGAAHAAFKPALNKLDLIRPGQRLEIDECKIDLMTLVHSSGRIDWFNEKEWLLFGVTSGSETGEVCEQADFEWRDEDGVLQYVGYDHNPPKSQILRKEQV
ncbi:hypothetical protein [Phaeobacter gallaeciensis]|uniref:hypothetical protein n=1 Tax=Phaeobacter gallaeciensis TaxID=60890 RepID=UPI00237F7DAB|nr:hypothetical protein [Phaeobacter gallaeciensis]MDE4099701.1 hypothetical protein [Phaeobacter gallaeciensis]MDE4108564.1 hypothetical protein [Phaeobacter gallaeciensis]MDE4110420.1 hypothetical protein [Phaeobacter gallaeciensis]MDE4117342.1 hypothetical protein [Phaeobacter gallaeciensis]MDE4121815.1 hypothetical protein [Phaeobacter gallaeciensis]